VQRVASVNNNTIVVVNTVGPIIVEAWIDHPNGTCLILSSIELMFITTVSHCLGM